MSTNKKVALITGANKGIGLEIARQLGKQGYIVVIGSRDEKKGRPALEKLRSEKIDAHIVKLDVQSQADVDALPNYFKEKFGRLDVLINNAGVAEWTSDDIGSFRRTLDTNIVGVAAVTYALLPLIKEGPEGRIVNQSSELGSLTRLTEASDQYSDFINIAYTTSKAALNGFTVALALKLKGTKVKVNSAHPGWVKTDLGGDAAPMEVVDGAKTAVMLATLPNDGPTGAFFHMKNRLPW